MVSEGRHGRVLHVLVPDVGRIPIGRSGPGLADRDIGGEEGCAVGPLERTKRAVASVIATAASKPASLAAFKAAWMSADAAARVTDPVSNDLAGLLCIVITRPCVLCVPVLGSIGPGTAYVAEAVCRRTKRR